MSRVELMDAGVKSTTAYIISRQIMDHIYGEDEELSDEDFSYVSSEFRRRAGSWESLTKGDMRSVKALEDSLASLVNTRRLVAIASRIAGVRGAQ